MTPIYTGQTKLGPPKQDEGKTRELADAIKRREHGKATEKLMEDHGRMKIEKEKG